MKVLKNKKFIISISSLLAIVLVACLSYGIVASWLTKETLQSSVEISLLLQGDEADIYESPVTLTSKGTYELATVGTKDTDGNYVGNDVGVGEKPEPSRKNYYDYVMPGVNIPKDPKVFITKKSGAPAYLYIEVFEHNFPEYFTEEGFEELGVNDTVQNPNEVKPIYYDLEDYWTPVYQDNGEQARGVNGGALYVYYNENDYFINNEYNKNFQIGTGNTIINQGATYLSSYIMKNESTGPDKIDKQQYYGTNEVKTVDGQPMDCPYFNILKEDTVYVSEKYIHPEYYSTLYSGLAEITGKVTKEGHDFGLYFFSYMASAKVDGTYASPFEAYEKAGFMEEEAYLMHLYESTDNNPENIPQERILYVWAEHTYMDNGKEKLGLQEAVDNYFGDDQPYKIVLMDSFEVENKITVPVANFVLDMNGKTLTAGDSIYYNTWFSLAGGCDVIIRGNGTIDMEQSAGYMFMVSGKLTIEDGNFIRDYNPHKTSEDYSGFYGNIQASGNKSDVRIYGGYFDNGYWNLDDSYFYQNGFFGINKKRLLPLYDIKTGKGWLVYDDGTYVTVDPDGKLWRVKRDADGNYMFIQKKDAEGTPLYAYPGGGTNYIYLDEHEDRYYRLISGEKYYLTQAEDGRYSYVDNTGATKWIKSIFPAEEELLVEAADNEKVYVRKKDEKGNLIITNDNEYLLEEVTSFYVDYGPCAKAIGATVGKGGSGYDTDNLTVFGGTFVVQNPAWGDEISGVQNYIHTQKEPPEAYNPQRFFNPWYSLFSANTQEMFLYGQRVWENERIPDGYTITESNTTYTYEDENGEIKSFYVPVYTVNYSGEIPD